MSAAPQSPAGADRTFIKGADISMLPRIENNGGMYTQNGEPRGLLPILQDHGFNYIRLRLWHAPADGYCDLNQTLAMAERIRSQGMGFLLDFHYSDTWADPGTQSKPAAWSGLSHETLGDSVYHYTRDVISALHDRHVLPDIVQIGNEIICGMLWNDGRICGMYDDPTQWSTFTTLLTRAINGVADALPAGDSVQIMIHIDRGGDTAGCEWFFDHILARGVDFDIIGLSFYPWWHGTLDDLKRNLDALAARYEKDIIVVETAYPWTLDWHDDMHNIIGLPDQLHRGYPATREGQAHFLTDLIDIIGGVQGEKGLGLFYWEPGYISTLRLGSSWENVTLFDFNGEILNSVTVFETHPVHPF